MPIIKNNKGLSILELLLAVGFVTVMVVILSLTFSRASGHTLKNRQRTIATYIANAQIESIKSQPYNLLDNTDVTASGAGLTALSAVSCDCSQISDFSILPSTISLVAGTSFTSASCINAVSRSGTSWPSTCSSPSPTAYKNVLVRVWWTQGTQTYTITQESMMSR